MDEDELIDEKRKMWISRSVDILGSGKGHIGVINFLRTQGLSPDSAKVVSYDIFNQAKARLMRQQLPHRIIAWILIGVGAVSAIVLFIMGWVAAYTFVAVGLGLILLFRLPNPKRLPKSPQD